MTTIVHIIEKRVQSSAALNSFTFLADGETASEVVSFGEIRNKALATAAHLPAGKTVLILLPQGISFIQTFFGCLYARAIAVPAAVPTRHRGLDNLQNIIADAEISYIITNRKIHENLTIWFGEDSFRSIVFLFAEEVCDADFPLPSKLPEPEQIAFLQYTSGSTDKPKAVVVTHENIFANSEIIRKCFRNTPESLSVCWLPSFHDMGLIDGIIQPLFSNFPAVLMSPTHFLQRPVRWFKAMSKYGATYSGAPNFAFDFCVERIRNEELESVDLSGLGCLYNGSEPIRANTIRRFVERFSSIGISENKIFTCYGLAEATLAVTTSKIGTFPTILRLDDKLLRENRVKFSDVQPFTELVSCGGTHSDTKLKIVDPETLNECEENEIGEIWAGGKSIAQGYLNRTPQTAEIFVEFANERFLRTGDLGFWRQNELFITGRIKDLIIIRGKNHYPGDIEQTVSNSHECLQSNGCAAFSAEIEVEEKLVIIQEIKRSYRKKTDFGLVSNLIAARISQNHGLIPFEIVFIKQGDLPKTTSGKIRRRESRKMWHEGSFNFLPNLNQ